MTGPSRAGRIVYWGAVILAALAAVWVAVGRGSLVIGVILALVILGLGWLVSV